MEGHQTFVTLVTVVSIMVILSTTEAGSAIPTKCPKVNSKNKTIHLAHESDCTKFYKCDWGKRVLFDCPFMDAEGNRLHFNPVRQVCDWPWQAGCRYGDSSDETIEDDLVSTKKPSRKQTTVGTSSPSKRTRTTPKVTSTTIETKWSEATESSSTQTTPSTTVSRLPHESDCSLFYEIINGKKYLRQCLNGLHFSPTALDCMWPREAGCESTMPIPTTTPTDSNSVCNVCGDCGDIKHGSLVPHECQCENYYQCYNGDMILHECPKGLHFNAERYTCDYPQSAGCSANYRQNND